MTRCSTWHIRVDVVEDRGQATARARLVGAPTAMVRPDPSQQEGNLEDLAELLGTWRPIEELGPVLALALSAQHGAQHGIDLDEMPLPEQRATGLSAQGR